MVVNGPVKWRREQAVVENVVTAGISPSSRFSYWKERRRFLNCSVYSSYSRSTEPGLCWVTVLFVRISSKEVSESGENPVFSSLLLFIMNLCRRSDNKKAWTLIVIADFSLRVAEVPICHLDLSRDVCCLLEAHIRNVTKRLFHLVKPKDYHALLLFHTELGCNKKFAKYQKGLCILQKDVEAFSSILLAGDWEPRNKINGSREWLTARLVPCSGFWLLWSRMHPWKTVDSQCASPDWGRWACSGKETGWTCWQSF